MKQLYIVIILLIVSCSTTKNFSEDKIHYRKTACLGKCPVFDLYVYDNGKVIFNGVNNTKIKGEATYHISAQQVKLLKGELSKLSSVVDSESKKGRDLPKTIVNFDNKTLAFKGNKNLIVFNNLLKQLDLLH
ncbi:DUF6438 domain-containing protein [Tenacibaculum jejuense]|uniref:DUF6438 domain-containing protein n=1 Tax=Tenacibaculum jejuense TaxID=584609 RepID=A0A238U7A1_9FLAO|nr:DUF6438 domain-containing protein [Tenacibaculum jejuense]SNR14260.1 protein of unknown function [Tenacibaculum jejuense]